MGGDTGKPMADSCWYLVETNTILQSNYPLIKNRYIKINTQINTPKKTKMQTSMFFMFSFMWKRCIRFNDMIIQFFVGAMCRFWGLAELPCWIRPRLRDHMGPRWPLPAEPPHTRWTPADPAVDSRHRAMPRQCQVHPVQRGSHPAEPRPYHHSLE